MREVGLCNAPLFPESIEWSSDNHIAIAAPQVRYRDIHANLRVRVAGGLRQAVFAYDVTAGELTTSVLLTDEKRWKPELGEQFHDYVPGLCGLRTSIKTSPSTRAVCWSPPSILDGRSTRCLLTVLRSDHVVSIHSPQSVP